MAGGHRVNTGQNISVTQASSAGQHHLAPSTVGAPKVGFHFSIRYSFFILFLGGQGHVPTRLQRAYRFGPPFPPLGTHHWLWLGLSARDGLYPPLQGCLKSEQGLRRV